MFISMQGTWTIHVKSMESDNRRRFVSGGAASQNGNHTATAGMSPLMVTGALWTIATQYNSGAGFQQSDTRIKFPVLQGGNYKFDIESNDDPSFVDFDDLILTCSTPADPSDYLVYGNVSTYSRGCYYNPCYRGWLVIDTAVALRSALQNPLLADVVGRYYPERVPPVIVNPNPPDPGPFLPLMINLGGSVQPNAKVANIFRRTQGEDAGATAAKRSAKDTKAEAISPATDLKFERSASLPLAQQTSTISHDT